MQSEACGQLFFRAIPRQSLPQPVLGILLILSPTAIRMLWKQWRHELPEPSQMCQKECREARVDPGLMKPSGPERRVQTLALGDYSDIGVCRKRQRTRRSTPGW